jgi:hypothetical protein
MLIKIKNILIKFSQLLRRPEEKLSRAGSGLRAAVL